MLETIFSESRSFSLPTSKSSCARIDSTVEARLDVHRGVLLVDLAAVHTSGCEDDGSPKGCRFCHPSFPMERRDLKDARDMTAGEALRYVISVADLWHKSIEARADGQRLRHALTSHGGHGALAARLAESRDANATPEAARAEA
jgi:hypothetical protein